MLSHDRLSDRYSSLQMQLFTHSPDAANPWDYFPLPDWSQKIAGAVLFGATEYRLYHLRCVIADATYNATHDASSDTP